MYSPAINKLIEGLRKLPGVGEHTAERYVLHWLKSGKKEVTELAAALEALLKNIKSCELCWDFSDQNPCRICRDPERDRATICVVAEPTELSIIERTGTYRGRYQVLRGLLTADADSLANLKIKELLDRLQGAAEPKITEVVLALNPTLPGETTMLFLEQEIKTINPKITITRLARGLPMGSDLRYADEITLGSAIKNRIAS